jgi:hypothetical protein
MRMQARKRRKKLKKKKFCYNVAVLIVAAQTPL